MTNLAELRTKLPSFLQDPDPGVYNSNNFVVLDFETTTHRNGLALYPENSLLLACWTNGKDHPRPGRNARWAGEFDQEQLVRDIQDADFLVAHNAKFELQWLDRCGLDLANVLVWCTQIAEYVIGGNRWAYQQLSLQRCATRRGWEGKDDLVSKMIKNGVDTRDIPETWMLRYCMQDVAVTYQLFEDQRRELDRSGKTPVVFTRCLATPVLARIERAGLQLDAALVEERFRETQRRYSHLENELERVAGGLNWNSSVQLRGFLYDQLGFSVPTDHRRRPMLTKGGAAKTDAATIERLQAQTKKQREFLALYREARSVGQELTKYLTKFQECCENDGGVLYAQFNQTNTKTHRLSSSGLDYRTQFQNLPRAYKPMFRSKRDGWLVGEADGAQLEFRIAAHLGRDAQALADIVNGTDVHAATAAILTEAGEPTTRQEAKPHTFKPLYGGSSGTPAQQTYYQWFKDRYEGVTAAQNAWIGYVLDSKRLRTEWGMEFFWPDTRMSRDGYVSNTTAICNFPVQSLATAEIIPVAFVYFWHYLQHSELQMELVNTIHDSIIVELPPEEEAVFHELAQQCLITEVYGYLDRVYDVQLTVPLGAGVKAGPHWSEGDEAKYEAQEQLYNQ